MSRPKSNPRGRIRRWTRRLVILLVLLVVALAALTAVAPRIAGAYLDGRTLNAPAGPSGATIRLEQLRLRWTGAQEVGAFTLTDNATGDAVAQGALSASVTLLDLLQGTTDLGVVTLTGSADLTADESGLPAILQSPPDDRAGAAPGAPTTTGPSPLEQLRPYRATLRLDNFTATYRSPQLEQALGQPLRITSLTGEATIDNLQLTADFSGAAMDDATFTITGDGALNPGAALPAGALRATMEAPGERVNALARGWLAPAPDDAAMRFDASIEPASDDAAAWILNLDAGGKDASTRSALPRAALRARLDADGVRLLEPASAGIAAGPALLDAAGLRAEELTVDAPARAQADIRSLALPWRDPDDWTRGPDLAAASLDATLTVAPITGAVRLPDAPDPRALNADKTTLTLRADALGASLELSATGAATLDDDPAGSLDLDATITQLLRGGALNPAARFEGRAQLRAAATSLLQPLFAATPLRLAEDIGPTVDLTLDGRTEQDDTLLDLRIASERLTGEAHARVSTDRVSLRNGGGRLRLTGPAPLLARLAGDTLRIDAPQNADSRIVAHLNALDIPLRSGAPDLRRASLDASIETTALRLAHGDPDAEPLTINSATIALTRSPDAAAQWRLTTDAAYDGQPLTLSGDGDFEPAWSDDGAFDAARSLAGGAIQAPNIPAALPAAFAPAPDRRLIREALAGPANLTITIDSTLDGADRRWAADARIESEGADAALAGDIIPGRAARLARAEAGVLLTPSLAERLARRFAPEEKNLPILVENTRANLRVSPLQIDLDNDAPLTEHLPDATATLTLDRPLSMVGVPAGGDRRIALALHDFSGAAHFIGGGIDRVEFGAAMHDPDASGSPRVANLQGSASIGRTILGRATLAEVDIPALERLLERDGLIAPVLGDTAALTIALRPEENSADARALRVAVESPRLNTSADVRVLPDRLVAAAPFEAAVTLTAAWMNARLAGADADGPRNLSVDAPVDATVRVQRFAVGLDDAPHAPDAFDLDASLTAPALALRARDGQTFTYSDISARLREGDAAGQVRFDASLRDDAADDALEISGRVERLADAAGRPVDESPALFFTASGAFPAALVDALADANGRIAELVGPGGAVEASGDNLTRDAGALSMRIESPRALAAIEGELQPGLFRATRPATIELRAITPELGEMVFQQALPLLGRVEKRPEDGPAVINAENLTIPTDADLARLSGSIRADMGRLRYRASPFFGRVLTLTNNNPETDLFRQWDPFTATIVDGIISFQRMAMPVGEFNLEVRGDVNLVAREAEIITYAPLASLSDDIREVANIPGVGEMTRIPLRTKGSFGQMRTQPALDLLVEESIRSPGRILEDIFRRNR